MALQKKIVFHKGKYKSSELKEEMTEYSPTFPKRYKEFSREKKLKWYHKKLDYPIEELKEAWEVAEEYLYKILSFAEREEEFSKEELDEARKIFYFARNGPRAHYLVADPSSKLTSADVLYFLSSSSPATILAKKYEIHPDIIREIRKGVNEVWEWEYRFVRRLKAIIKGKLISHDNSIARRVYSINKMHSATNKEILAYTTSQRKAKALRESLTNKKERENLIKKGTFDIIYPIELIEVL